MKKWTQCVTIAVLSCALSACATKYGEWKFGVPGGYRNTEISENVWEITGRTTEYNYAGASGDMALYRAAEIATVRGFSHLQILSGAGTEYRLGYSYGGSSAMGERVDLTVRFANNPDQTAPANGKEQGKFYEVSEILENLGARLKINRAPQM